jgi:hypothetical protein
MSEVSTWSVTAASNNSATPDGWPEGQAASTVNDCAREMMAAIARWYPTVPLLNAATNTFTGTGLSLSNAADPAITVSDTTAPITGTFQANGSGGGIALGSTTAHPLNLITNAATRFSIDSSGNYNFVSGTVTTSGLSASEVGYQGVPAIAAKTADYTVVAADDGKSIRATSACDEVTVQSSGGLPVGGVVMVIANRSGTVTIVQGSGATLYLAGTAFGTTGNRTIADGGVAFVYHYVSGSYIVSGTGVS